ncbi:phage tail protein, partial [Enterobacter hormaechei]|uniref:phage tail protein n=1 Tax=Enterobacter hormaechei TaxID=158836 RepID=UPI002011D5C5
KELADALGNDPNFATTVLNKLAEKLAKDQNGADIPDPALFVKNLGLGEGSALPVGVPIPWPSATLPTGWLKCNGAAFTAAQYPKLAQAYPALKLPDLRGEFIRGWDDGRGVDGGRMLLEGQADSFRSHNHGVTAWDAWDSSVLTPNDREGDLLLSTDNAVRAGGSVNGKSNGKYGTAGNGGNETRPRNIAFNYIVRAA